MNQSHKPWLVERQRADGTWAPVDRYLTAEQARAVATLWSWQRNAWHRARLVLRVLGGEAADEPS
jgi:hypothetical protein